MTGLQKLNELRKQAKALGIEGYSKMKTGELEAILATKSVTEEMESTGAPVETVADRYAETPEQYRERAIREVSAETGEKPEFVAEMYNSIVSMEEEAALEERVENEDTAPFEGVMLPEPGDDEYPVPAPVHPIDRQHATKRPIVPARHVTKHKAHVPVSKPSKYRR